MNSLYFNAMGFVENLKYMGVGMLGVFIIIGVIMAATYIIGKLPTDNGEEYTLAIQKDHMMSEIILASGVTLDVQGIMEIAGRIGSGKSSKFFSFFSWREREQKKYTLAFSHLK